MDRKTIIDSFLPLLSNTSKMEYRKMSFNPFFAAKYIGSEMLFQFFVTRLLDDNNIEYVLLQTEGRKTVFERFISVVLGKKRGWADLFIPSHNVFFELKAENPYMKDGSISTAPSAAHLREQADFLDKMRKLNYTAEFLWPEVLIEKFSKILNLQLCYET